MTKGSGARTGGRILVDQLRIQGCDRIFTVPGESFLAVLDALHVPIASVAFPPYPDIRLAAPSYARIAEVIRTFKPDVVHCASGVAEFGPRWWVYAVPASCAQVPR